MLIKSPFTSEQPVNISKGLSFSFKSAENGYIEGYGSTFGGNPDMLGDLIAKGAFAKTLAAHKQVGSMPLMLWSHTLQETIGRWESVEEDEIGLRVVGQINLNGYGGRGAWEKIQKGQATGLSIGYNIPKGGEETLSSGVRLLKEVVLQEVSVVGVPANPAAQITSIKSITSKGELVDLLRDIGLPKSAAARVAAGGWPALAGADHQKAIDLAAQIDAATAQIRRL